MYLCMYICTYIYIYIYIYISHEATPPPEAIHLLNLDCSERAQRREYVVSAYF